MNTDTRARPGFARLASGVILLVLWATYPAADSVAGSGPRLFAGTAGVALGLWGWSVLRRAKAARPDLTWWQFLRTELIAAAVAAVVLPLWVAMPAELREGLVRRLQELSELISIARGRL